MDSRKMLQDSDTDIMRKTETKPASIAISDGGFNFGAQDDIQ